MACYSSNLYPHCVEYTVDRKEECHVIKFGFIKSYMSKLRDFCWENYYCQ